MTREEVKLYLPYIKALAEGKTIQQQIIIENGAKISWKNVDDPNFCIGNIYRIKPESEYHPFNLKEECWNKMLKHKPFGWVIEKENKEYFNINSVGETGVGGYTYRQAFDKLVFADGTPFGIKE